MANVIRFVLTVVFGFLWWWVFHRIGGLGWLMILGSILAVCVCCCRDRETGTGGVWEPGQWSYEGYLVCIRRCMQKTLVLMVSLFVIGVLAVWAMTGMAPTAAELTDIALAAIFGPLFVRLICCAYEG
jgi:hypothetical protein